MTCRATPLKVPMISGLDHKDRKPISVCTTKKGRDGEWLVNTIKLRDIYWSPNRKNLDYLL